MKTNPFLLSLFLISSLVFFSFNSLQKKPWVVPDKYDKMVNPVKPDAESLKEAKALWVKHCQILQNLRRPR